MIGDFTWTAWDYIGEAGIGKATFYEPGDPNIGNPVTAENYTKGRFTSYHGRALAVLRSGYEVGEARLTVCAEGMGQAEITLAVYPNKQ